MFVRLFFCCICKNLNKSNKVLSGDFFSCTWFCLSVDTSFCREMFSSSSSV